MHMTSQKGAQLRWGQLCKSDCQIAIAKHGSQGTKGPCSPSFPIVCYIKNYAFALASALTCVL